MGEMDDGRVTREAGHDRNKKGQLPVGGLLQMRWRRKKKMRKTLPLSGMFGRKKYSDSV